MKTISIGLYHASDNQYGILVSGYVLKINYDPLVKNCLTEFYISKETQINEVTQKFLKEHKNQIAALDPNSKQNSELELLVKKHNVELKKSKQSKMWFLAKPKLKSKNN